MFSKVIKLPKSSAQKPLVRFDIVGMFISCSYISIEFLVPSESIAVFFTLDRMCKWMNGTYKHDCTETVDEWSLDGSLQRWSYNTWIGHLR